MAKTVLVGGDRVIATLNKEISQIRGATYEGLYQAGLLVKARSVVKTPVDTGNLRGSAYVQGIEHGKSPVVEIGYTASYAPFVHEIKKNYRAPGTGWKFLENALKENVKGILDQIHKAIRRK
jgi:hypothetical protein